MINCNFIRFVTLGFHFNKNTFKKYFIEIIYFGVGDVENEKMRSCPQLQLRYRAECGNTDLNKAKIFQLSTLMLFDLLHWVEFYFSI